MVELLSPNDNEAGANAADGDTSTASKAKTKVPPKSSSTSAEAISPENAVSSVSETKPASDSSIDTTSTSGDGAGAQASVSRKPAAKSTSKSTSPKSSGKSTARAEKSPKSDPRNVMAATKSNEKENNRIAEARAKNLDLAISQIQKDFGEAAIMRLGTETHMDVEVIPTGNLIIDRALGAGGFPRGRIVEVYGPESSGKTTLTLTAVAQAQKAGGLAAFVDVEHALDPQYAKRLGVDLDNLLLSQPSSGEEALRIVETLVRSNALDVIVLDSVAALVTKQELDGEIGDATVGAQARLMSAALRKLTAIISKARTVVIFTNQIREKVGVMFGSPETQPGGRALKFYSSVRCDIRRTGSIKASDGTVTGNRTKLKVVKNKVAPPYGEAEFDIMFNEGISAAGSLLDLAIEHEILQKRGSWISYKGSQMAQGRDAAKAVLKSDEALFAEVEAEVKAAMDADPES